VEPVTDRVVIINQGRVVADGIISELKKRAMVTNRISPELRAGAEGLEASLKAPQGLRGAHGHGQRPPAGSLPVAAALSPANFLGGVSANGPREGLGAWRACRRATTPWRTPSRP